MSISKLIFSHKNIKCYLRQWYTYYTKWEKYNVVMLHIYWARAIFLLFYDDQDILSTYCEIQMSTYQLIFTHTNISKNLWDNDIYTLQNGGGNCGNASYLWSYSHCPTILWWPRHCFWVNWNTNVHFLTNIHQ